MVAGQSKPNYNYRHRQQHQIFLLRSATILLQSATGITKSDNLITKYDRTEDRCNFCHNQCKELAIAI